MQSALNNGFKTLFLLFNRPYRRSHGMGKETILLRLFLKVRQFVLDQISSQNLPKLFLVVDRARLSNVLNILEG